MRIVMCVLVAVSFLMADPIDSTVNSIMKMKLYEPDQLKRQLEKIEKEFPGLNLSTDSVLLREIYARDGSKRSGKMVNSVGDVIANSRDFRRANIFFRGELISDPDNEEIPNSNRNFKNWGKVQLVGGIFSGTGGVLLVTAGILALTEVLRDGDDEMVYPDKNSDTAQSVSEPTPPSDRKYSRLEIASGMASAAGVCVGIGAVTLSVYLPTLIIKVQQNKRWQDEKISYHNRRRISLAIKMHAQQ